MNRNTWPMPVTTTRADGSARRVGVEFALLGLTVEGLAGVVATALSGEVGGVTAADYRVDVPDLGSCRIRLDVRLLKAMARQSAGVDAAASRRLQDLAGDPRQAAAATIVPCALSVPLLAMAALPGPLTTLVNAIRAAGGQGAGPSGLQLNVEPPDLAAQTVLALMKAFVCLRDWLRRDEDTDLPRRLLPSIAPYPAEYEELLVATDYWPDWSGLAEDYLYWNPTQNRGLDLVPLLAQQDEELVARWLEDDQVDASPALRYRLAKCAVEDPGWSLESSWRRWLQVEHLAADTTALGDCSRAFLEHRRQSRAAGRDASWRQAVTRWLQEL